MLKLENEKLILECTSKGGEMQHLIKKADGQEYLYQGDQGWSGKNPSLFPMVGNTYSEDYEIDGKKYAMKNHGLIRYGTLTPIDKDNSIVFEYRASADTLKQYPFNFVYQIEYHLDDDKVMITYHIKNEDEKDMPFGFGLHPGFICPRAGEKFEDYKLEFEKDEDCHQLIFDPSFEKPIEYQSRSFKSWQLSRDDIKKYATIIYKDLASEYVTLMYKDEPRVKVSIKDFPFLALWSHPSCSDFICIEPWYSHADFEKDTPDFYHREGTIVLKPNETWSCSYWIEVM